MLVGGAGANSRPRHLVDNNNRHSVNTKDAAAGNQFLVTPLNSVVQDVVFTHQFTALGDIADLTVGALQTDKDFVPESVNAAALTNIGGLVSAEKWHGPIGHLYLTDGSPFQQAGGRPILTADGTRYIEVPRATFTGEYDITFSWIRTDLTGTTQTDLAFDSTNAGDNRIRIFDSGSASKDRFQVVHSGSFTNFDNALVNVAQGQHTKIRLNRKSNGAIDLYIDGEFYGSRTDADTFYLDIIAAGSIGSVGDFILHDVVGGSYVHYKIDEGTGTDIKAYDDKGIEIEREQWTDPPDTINGAWVDNGGGSYTITNGNYDNNLRIFPDMVEGELYRVTFTMAGRLTGAMVVSVGGTSSSNYNVDGTYVVDVVCGPNPQNGLSLFGANGITCTVTDISATRVANGTVTPDAAWGNVPDNSRFYPMDEGSGNTFIDEIGGHDATIQGYVDDTPWHPVGE